MLTLRQLATQAWLQEKQRQKQVELKKHKRKAKKIEDSIDELLPREAEQLAYVRNLEDPNYGVTVSVADSDGAIRFTYDAEDSLAIISECSRCRTEVLSKPIESLDDLGRQLENFEPSTSHSCPVES